MVSSYREFAKLSRQSKITKEFFMSCHDRYAQLNRQRLTVLVGGALALVFFVLVDLSVGSSNLSLSDALSALIAGPNGAHISSVIVWDIRLLEEHGVKNYPLGDLSVDLVCQERTCENDEPVVTALCEKPIEIEIRWKNGSKIITATKE